MTKLEITARVQDTLPSFENGVMTLKQATVVVSFQSPSNYFGGQIVLTHEEDGISFQSNEEEFISKGIEKAKKLIADAELKAPYVPQAPLVEPPHADEEETNNKGE
ncbi:hypothetical protein [Leuconostoc citreum]